MVFGVQFLLPLFSSFHKHSSSLWRVHEPNVMVPTTHLVYLILYLTIDSDSPQILAGFIKFTVAHLPILRFVPSQRLEI